MLKTYKILGKPHAQGRPRFAKVGAHVHAYDPKESRQAKENMRAQLVAQHPYYHDSGPLSVDVEFLLPRPRSVRKGVMLPAVRPDLTNMVKAVEDAANGVLWRDDAQICELTVAKTYTSDEPMTILRVARIDDTSD